MTQIYKYLLSDSSKNSTFILNWVNNSIFASVVDSILDSRSSNSTSIFQFCDSASTRLRFQSFNIRLDDEPRVGTPLRRYLVLSQQIVITACSFAFFKTVSWLGFDPLRGPSLAPFKYHPVMGVVHL